MGAREIGRVIGRLQRPQQRQQGVHAGPYCCMLTAVWTCAMHGRLNSSTVSMADAAADGLSCQPV